jgi:radical SAM protein with 4Fe4S-binding SPASM domain
MHSDTLKFWNYYPVKKPIYKGKFCNIPFKIMQIDADGDVQLCDCQSHMPYTIGNIYKNSLQQIWSGELAQQVRQSVIDEDFTYCSWSCSQLPVLPDCPAVLPIVPDFPYTIKIDLDRSCNLKCPSCRENVIIEKNSTNINKQIEIFEEIKQWALNNPTRQINVLPISSGEIFASHSGLKFLKSLVDYPYENLKLEINTNGTLINHHRDLLLNIKHLLKNFSISIDAATSETYDVVRGGDWQEVMSGIDFLHNTLQLPLRFNFCIQQSNYHEIDQFAELAAKFDAYVLYQKLVNWGHWNTAWWHDNNVFDRTRDTFNVSLNALKLVKQKYNTKIFMAAELNKYLEKQDIKK